MPWKYVQIIHVRGTCHIRQCKGWMLKDYAREESQKIQCSKYMSKMTMPGKYVPEVDIREIYTRTKWPYVLPVRYVHGQHDHTGYPQWMSMYLRTYSMSAVPMTVEMRS